MRATWPALTLPLLLAVLSGAAGAAAEVRLVPAADGQPYRAVTESFITAWEAAPSGPPAALTVGLQSTDPPPGTLLVPLGVEAARRVLATYPDHPVFAGLVPQPTWNLLLAQHPGRAPRSAMWLDQPEHRVLALARLVAPSARRVGVLLGPTSASRGAAVAQAAERVGLEVALRSVLDGEDPLAAQQELLTSVDVLVALPDPYVWNRASVGPLMLASFRARTPLVGVSRGLLTAGATAVVYATPEQIGSELARSLLTGHRDGRDPVLPAAGTMPVFVVETNVEVARSLGLNLPDGDALARGLREQER